MNIALHKDLETFIGEQVSTGEYRSPDEVVTEALFLLWQQNQQDEAATGQHFPDVLPLKAAA